MSRKTNNNDVHEFWSLISRLYQHRDIILESSNKIIDYSYQVESMDTDDIMSQALKGAYNSTELKSVFCEVQKEINTILFYSEELYPHLANKDINQSLSRMAYLINLEMSYPDKYLAFKLRDIALGLRLFAQMSTRTRINPTKKSLKFAFGFQIGSEWAAIKPYIERH